MKPFLRLYHFFPVVFISIVLNGCLQNMEKESNYNNQSILLATQILDNYTKQEYEDLKSKLFEPTTSERAKIWYPTAEKIKSLTTEAYSSIDSSFKVFDEANLEKSKSKLLELAKKYETSILQVNPELWQNFKNEFATLIDSNYFKNFTTAKSNKEFQDKINNTISIIANRTISFCNLKTSPGCILRYEKFSVLIGQNSKHFKSGDKIEITAGVGSFSSASQPIINIDNETISINEFGYAEFKKVIQGSNGKHIIPIIISYYSPDGTQKTTKHEVEYFIDQ